MQDKKVAVLVLGAPRSGTSLISHVLCKLGFYFGDHSRFVDPVTHPWNPIFFELQSLNDLNDGIIRSQSHEYLDFDWFPLKEEFDEKLIDKFGSNVKSFLEREFNFGENIGLKDPRFCFTLPIWLSLLRRMGYVVRLVWVVRDLSACLLSNSLLVSDTTPMRPERLVSVSSYIAAYMLDGEEYFVANYDEFIKNPSDRVHQLAKWLQVTGHAVEEACEVIHPSLRHNVSPQRNSLSPELSLLSKLLLEGSLSANHYLQFRENFNSHSYFDLLAEKNKLLSELRCDIEAKDAYIVGLEAAVAVKEQVISDLMKSISWQITAPLRAVKRIIDGIVRRVW